jgi:hypothetical protein
MTYELELTGLDGSNPLGFLAALGTLAELSADPSTIYRMSWVAASGVWRPRLHTERPLEASAVATRLAELLRLGTATGEDAKQLQEKLEAADKVQMHAKKVLKEKRDDLKKRKLRGEERQRAIDEEEQPLVTDYALKRTDWLKLLELASPSPELALGKDPGATPEHLRFTAERIAGHLSLADRRCGDLLAAFGSEAVFDIKNNRVRTTPFCFVTGSGHQYFLATVVELLRNVTSARIGQALFHPVPHADAKLSMRWDPVEDRRYAMMWSDPTSTGNEAKTNWALNLLAYRGLQLLPSVPLVRGVATTGFLTRDSGPEWTWPIWTVPVGIDPLRSLLALSELQKDQPSRAVLAACQVVEVFRSARLQVGNPPLHKLNFSPSHTA